MSTQETTQEDQRFATPEEPYGKGNDKLSARIYLGKNMLFVGARCFSLEKLQNGWSVWSGIESAVKAMVKHPEDKSPLTDQEMSDIRSCATTDVARRGLAELEQALKQGGYA